MENKRNLWVIPTDKPSRLVVDTIENKLSYQSILHNKTVNVLPQNIYITSNEEIKEGDWSLYGENTISKYYKEYSKKMYKKIILTDNKDLIKDGIQSIDDEFLEWFVKNQSCGEIQVKKSFHWDNGVYEYEIIIPKEEPKQRLEKYSERFDNKDNEIVEGIFNPETWGNRLVDDVPKQETLEEALNKFVRTMLLDQSVYIDFLQCAEFGAKWQIDKQDNFAVGFAEWSVARALGCDKFTINQDELNIYKKYIDTLNGN